MAEAETTALQGRANELLGQFIPGGSSQFCLSFDRASQAGDIRRPRNQFLTTNLYIQEEKMCAQTVLFNVDACLKTDARACLSTRVLEVNSIWLQVIVNNFK